MAGPPWSAPASVAAASSPSAASWPGAPGPMPPRPSVKQVRGCPRPGQGWVGGGCRGRDWPPAVVSWSPAACVEAYVKITEQRACSDGCWNPGPETQPDHKVGTPASLLSAGAPGTVPPLHAEHRGCSWRSQGLHSSPHHPFPLVLTSFPLPQAGPWGHRATLAESAPPSKPSAQAGSKSQTYIHAYNQLLHPEVSSGLPQQEKLRQEMGARIGIA